MDEFRDDGTQVCPIHGLRFNPELSQGCIKCGHPSQLPRKKSAAPKGLSRPPTNPPMMLQPSRPPASGPPSSFGPPLGRPATPPVPFEPSQLSSDAFAPMGQNASAAIRISLIPAPERKASRRGLILGLGAVALGGSALAAWILSPEGPTDWKKKVTEFRYGPGDAHTGALFLPTSAAEGPRPLLVLLHPARHPVDVCARYARHCEQHGWIAISTDAFGAGVNSNDGAEASALLTEARTRAKVDAGRAIVGGFDVAGDVACRLALVQPEAFGGAILECTGITPWRDVGALAQNDVSFFLFTRAKDPSRDKMATMKDEMERKGLRVSWSELAGGHEAMERDELDPAFAWLDSMRT